MNKTIKYLLCFCGMMILYGIICEPYTLKITRYYLKNNELKGVKIVYATDFHVGPFVWEKWRLKRVIKEINQQRGDLVILGGDYINRHGKKSTMKPQQIAKYLEQIEVPKVAVLGNHDSYYGKEDVKRALENVGIKVLENKNVKLKLKNKEVTVAGVADYNTDKPDIKKSMRNSVNPVIFITHSPDLFEKIPNKVDVAFAGHTHGGQVVLPVIGPLLVPTDSGKKYAYGIFYKNNKPRIVSSGLGTSVLPIRFYNRPEIVVAEFE